MRFVKQVDGRFLDTASATNDIITEVQLKYLLDSHKATLSSTPTTRIDKNQLTRAERTVTNEVRVKITSFITDLEESLK